MIELGAALPYCSGQVLPVLQSVVAQLAGTLRVVYWEPVPEFRGRQGWIAPDGSERLARWTLCGGCPERRWLRESSVFFFYGFFHPAPAMTWLMLRALRTGRPVMVLSEGLRERHMTMPRRFLMRLLSRYPQGKLLAVGHGAADDFRRLGLRWSAEPYGFCEEPLPSAVRSLGGSEFRLVTVGQLIPRKQQGKLMDWLAGKVWPVPMVLRVCGDGPERERLERQAERLRRPGFTIEFMGHLGRKELAETLAWADVCVHPADYEGWGVSLQQAAEAGLPLVISPGVRSGHGILVKDQWNGYVVDSADDLATAVTTLIRDPGLRNLMGVRSLEMAAPWRLDAAAARLAGMLQSLSSVD